MVSHETLTTAFMNAASDYLVILDRHTRVVYANKAFRDMFVHGDDASTMDFLSFMDVAAAPRALDALSSLDRGPRNIELVHISTDGKMRPVQYLFTRMDVEGMELIGGIGRDKTPDLELLGEITQLNIELESKQRELTEAYARLEQLAVVDHLTGLYNRHYFFTVVTHFFEEARRYDQPLSCFMMDVDHFKSINDRYGHLFGDHVLKMIANRLKASSRKSDLLARYGGEEFVFVTPNTDLRTAKMLGERIRSAVEREPCTLGNVTANLTISIGLSGTEIVKSGTLEKLMDTADQALYVAKRSGRNRCAIFVPQASVGA